MPQPIQYDGQHLDLSPRIFNTAAVVGSPALAAETIVASVTCTGDIAVLKGAALFGWCAFTAGTSGTGATLRLRQTGLAGTVVAATGAVTVVATQLYGPTIVGFDTGPVMPGQVYVLTLQITAGAAASAVSAAQLVAAVI